MVNEACTLLQQQAMWIGLPRLETQTSAFRNNLHAPRSMIWLCLIFRITAHGAGILGNPPSWGFQCNYGTASLGYGWKIDNADCASALRYGTAHGLTAEPVQCLRWLSFWIVEVVIGIVDYFKTWTFWIIAFWSSAKWHIFCSYKFAFPIQSFQYTPGRLRWCMWY